MSRGLTFQQDGFYHIYNRGTEKRRIFMSKADYDRFLVLLYLGNCSEPLSLSNGRRGSTSTHLLELEQNEPLVDLCAYCLMPNHFHLLVRESFEGGISRFMQRITTAYTMYFNTRYERTGSLFQGRFKAEDANEDRYLKYLISYIHLNPLKLFDASWQENGIRDRVEAVKYLEAYAYSSYPDYCGEKRLENKLLNRSALPQYFDTPKDFQQNILEWFGYAP